MLRARTLLPAVASARSAFSRARQLDASIRPLCASAAGAGVEQDPLLVEWRKFLDVGVALYKKGSLPRASQCLSRAYELLGSSVTVSSHQVLRARATTLLHLANVKREIAAAPAATHADKVEAGELYSTTVDLVSRSFGEMSAEMAATLLELGRHLMNTKDDKGAVQVLQRSLTVQTRYMEGCSARGEDVLAVALRRGAIVAELARALVNVGRIDDALKLKVAMNELFMFMNESDHPGLRDSMRLLASYHDLVGETEAAARLRAQLGSDPGAAGRPAGLKRASAQLSAQEEAEVQQQREVIREALAEVQARRAAEGRDLGGGAGVTSRPGSEFYELEVMMKDQEVRDEALARMGRRERERVRGRAQESEGSV